MQPGQALPSHPRSGKAFIEDGKAGAGYSGPLVSDVAIGQPGQDGGGGRARRFGQTAVAGRETMQCCERIRKRKGAGMAARQRSARLALLGLLGLLTAGLASSSLDGLWAGPRPVPA